VAEALVTDREIDNLTWRAFHLGLRVMAAQTGRDVTAAEIGDLVRVIRELAESDATLHDPTALTAKSPDMGEIIQRLGTLAIRHDRELAQRVFRGFIIGTRIKD
jgi:hypothetical protein